MAQQKLNLLQLAALRSAELRCRAPKIMRRQLADPDLRCVLTHQLPHCVLGCRFSLLSRMRLLTLKDLSVTRPAEFCFIEYNFSFISRVRGPHSVSEKHRHILDST